MKKHSGMRPQDIVILLKIITYGNNHWYIKDIANELFISQSEVSESLNRSVLAGLISGNKKRVMKSALFDFLICGLKYVYPVKPEAMLRGIKTSHSVLPLSREILSEEIYVWPYAEGDTRGFAIEPLYSNVPKACLKDDKLYELLALVDAIRIGNKREFNLAVTELKQRLG
jgi:predicted transcriptional regulator